MAATHDSQPPSRGRAAVLCAAAGVGFSSVITQLSLMREMLGAFEGNELVLGVILGNWLLLTGMGTLAGRFGRRLRDPGRPLAWALVLLAILPPVQVFLLRALRDVVFLHGQAIGPVQTVISSLVLLSPYCLVSGCFLTLACAALARQDDPRAIGRVYLADAIGSIVGGALFTFVLVQFLDHIDILYVPAAASLLLAGGVAWCHGPASLRAGPCDSTTPGRKVLAGLSLAAAAGVIALAAATDLDGLSTALQYPGQAVLFRGSSPYGRLVVAESAGQVTLIENGLPVLSTSDVQQVEEAVHYAMAQRPAARRVLLIAGGVSGTAKEILKYRPEEVTYVELDPLILDVGRRFLPGSLEDPRIRVVAADGRQFLRQTDLAYDVIIVDVPDPSTSQLNRFYTEEFFRQARLRMVPGGVLSVAIGHYENYVSDELSAVLSTARATLRRAFRNVLPIPGGWVFLLASDGELHADIAERVERAGVPTKLMNHHYLDATLTPGRLSAVAEAAARPAEVNRDFAPLLYYRHLQYWMSRFKTGLGPLEAVLLAAMAAYLIFLRPVATAVFAAGFAASAMEVVLLLAFQALCGSVYRQLGVIVTLFMAGLAAGAMLADRLRPRAPGRLVANLGFALAALGGLTPIVLSALAGAEGWLASPAGVQAVIGLLTFLLAGLVGTQFPIAGRAELATASLAGDGPGAGAAAASRLYTADFVGASLGALLAGTLLVPLLGVAMVCVLAAALNAAATACVILRKA